MPNESPRPTYSGEQARGGEIVLRRPWQRYVFIAGLAAAIIIALVIVAVWR